MIFVMFCVWRIPTNKWHCQKESDKECHSALTAKFENLSGQKEVHSKTRMHIRKDVSQVASRKPVQARLELRAPKKATSSISDFVGNFPPAPHPTDYQ